MRPRRLNRPPVLEALPAALRLEASPWRCVCSSCVPSLSEAERTAERWVQDRWGAARAAWCRANGYSLLELMRAERPRNPHGRKSFENTDNPKERAPK